MRTSYILVAAAVLLAACANDSETTAPISSQQVATTSSESSVIQAYPPGPSVSGKQYPAHVVKQVMSGVIVVDGWGQQVKSEFVTCPTGTIPVGGGHRIDEGHEFAHVTRSGPYGTSSWLVEVFVPVQAAAKFTVYAMCLQS